jgi:hypothetical protein
MQRINKMKSWLFEIINKIDKSLAKLTKRKTRPKLIKLRVKCGITTDTTEIQTIVKEYFNFLHCNKLENLEELDNFLDIYNLPKWK